MRTILRNVLPLFAVLLFTLFCCEAVSPRLFSAPQRIDAPAMEAAYTLGEGADAVLRLHVVANSNEREDQRIKLRVRDALLTTFAPMESLAEAEAVLLKEGGGVLETVERVLREEHCGYGAQLRFGVMDFPDKTYGDTLYPAGSYEALRVELGDAQGENWWCVLFPPICLLDIGVSDIPGSDELVFESDLLAFLRGNA